MPSHTPTRDLVRTARTNARELDAIRADIASRKTTKKQVKYLEHYELQLRERMNEALRAYVLDEFLDDEGQPRPLGIPHTQRIGFDARVICASAVMGKRVCGREEEEEAMTHMRIFASDSVPAKLQTRWYDQKTLPLALRHTGDDGILKLPAGHKPMRDSLGRAMTLTTGFRTLAGTNVQPPRIEEWALNPWAFEACMWVKLDLHSYVEYSDITDKRGNKKTPTNQTYEVPHNKIKRELAREKAVTVLFNPESMFSALPLDTKKLIMAAVFSPPFAFPRYMMEPMYYWEPSKGHNEQR